MVQTNLLLAHLKKIENYFVKLLHLHFSELHSILIIIFSSKIDDGGR